MKGILPPIFTLFTCESSTWSSAIACKYVDSLCTGKILAEWNPSAETQEPCLNEKAYFLSSLVGIWHPALLNNKKNLNSDINLTAPKYITCWITAFKITAWAVADESDEPTASPVRDTVTKVLHLYSALIKRGFTPQRTAQRKVVCFCKKGK